MGESEELITFGIRVHIGMHVSRSKPGATSPQECSEPRECIVLEGVHNVLDCDIQLDSLQAVIAHVFDDDEFVRREL